MTENALESGNLLLCGEELVEISPRLVGEVTVSHLGGGESSEEKVPVLHSNRFILRSDTKDFSLWDCVQRKTVGPTYATDDWTAVDWQITKDETEALRTLVRELFAFHLVRDLIGLLEKHFVEYEGCWNAFDKSDCEGPEGEVP